MSPDTDNRDTANDLAAGSRMGLGVDIIEISRMERALKRFPQIKDRAFSENERSWCESKPNPAVHYALAFAAKSAVARSLGPSCAGMRLRDVEVMYPKKGRPRAVLSGIAASSAETQGVREVYLSLSYTHETGVVSAAAVRDEDIPDKEEKRTAAEQIAERFRDIRGLLDDMGEFDPFATAANSSNVDVDVGDSDGGDVGNSGNSDVDDSGNIENVGSLDNGEEPVDQGLNESDNLFLGSHADKLSN